MYLTNVMIHYLIRQHKKQHTVNILAYITEIKNNTDKQINKQLNIN